MELGLEDEDVVDGKIGCTKVCAELLGVLDVVVVEVVVEVEDEVLDVTGLRLFVLFEQDPLPTDKRGEVEGDDDTDEELDEFDDEEFGSSPPPIPPNPPPPSFII